MKMRNFAMQFSKKKSKKRRLSIEQLEHEIHVLERDLISSPDRPRVIQDIENKKK